MLKGFIKHNASSNNASHRFNTYYREDNDMFHATPRYESRFKSA